MKKKLSILAVLVFAVAISTYSVGGTYAKYTSSTDVTGTAQVAKWAIAFTDGTNELTSTTFDLGRTANTNVADERIAPGTNGSFTFGIDGAGTEVAFTYGISFTVSNAPTNLKFYSDSTYSTEITADSNGVYTVLPATTVNIGDTPTASQTVYWKWAYTTGANETEITANDGTDTTDGVAAAEMTVSATLTATQVGSNS